jgi:hypothetical protein
VTASQHDGLGIVIEGAVDRFVGRPLAANPYSPTFAAEAHAAWVFGWRDADFLLAIRGQEEAARWLREEAA